MRHDLVKTGKQLARRALVVQLLVSGVATAVCGALVNLHHALSWGLGAAISIVPNVVFAWFAFRYAGARQNQQVARSFSQGAKSKLVISIILFVIAFKGLHAAPLTLFAGFAVATVSYWLTLLQQHQQ